MRASTTLIIVLLLLATSCSWLNKKDKDCSKIMPEKQMVAILTDMFLLEAYITNLQTTSSSFRDSAAHYYEALFHKHQITPAAFEQAYQCYLLNPVQIDRVMEEVINTLTILQSQPQQEDSLSQDSKAIFEDHDIQESDIWIGDTLTKVMQRQ